MAKAKNNTITLNKYDFCWRCGGNFDKDQIKKRKTYHHSIPQMYSPRFNIKIPICQECHHDINPTNQTAMFKFIKEVETKAKKFMGKLDVERRDSTELEISPELEKLMEENK